MARIVINNGDSGLAVRNAINSMTAEIFSGQMFPTVATFADLPAASGTSGEVWRVTTASGVFLVNRRGRGLYGSDGSNWNYLGDFPTTASDIANVPAGGVAAINVQSAIDELDTDKADRKPFGTAVITPSAQDGSLEWEESVAAVGVLPGDVILCGVGPALDDDENCPEMLDVVSISALAGTDAIVFVAAFLSKTTGPIKLNWKVA